MSCSGAWLAAVKGGDALSADGLESRGTVFLANVVATGEVRLLGATLGGNLDCSGARLTEGEGGKALNAGGAVVEGSLFLRGGAQIDGVLDLAAARIGTINDEAASWPAAGNLILNRCSYGAFTGKDVTAAKRIDWLGRQDWTRFGKDFWPQPWEQCARVLREMGHREDARAVLIDKERRQRAWRRARQREEAVYHEPRIDWLRDRIVGAIVGYGHLPFRALLWLAGFWLLGAMVFSAAEDGRALKPNNPFILRSPEWAACAAGYAAPPGVTAAPRNAERYASQLDCFLAQPEARGYPRFHAFVYSADTLLPIVEMEMQAYWIPDSANGGGAARAYLWAHIALGWALSLLAVAGFTGLIKSDGQ